MSIVYLKLKSKERAREILEEILRKYGDELAAYDIEINGLYPLYDPNVDVELKNVSQRGGSLSITIPKPVSEYLKLDSGDCVVLVTRRKVKKVYLDKATHVRAEPSQEK